MSKLILPKIMYDNTMLNDFDRCMRYGYYRHVRKWVREGMALKPGFGIAWHAGLDLIWLELAGKNKIQEKDIPALAKKARKEFNLKWVELDLPDEASMAEEMEITYRGKPKRITREEKMNPYTPANAERMYNAYILSRRGYLSKIELLSIEQPFIFPLYPDRTDTGYMGLIDKKFIHWTEGRTICDHKSTGSYAKDSGLRMDYWESFSPWGQGYGYCVADTMERDDDGITTGAWADVSVVHKTADVHEWIPNRTSTDVLEAWLADTRFKVQHIESQKQAIKEGNVAFPMSTGSCTSRGICAYKDICTGQPDWVDCKTPIGFEISDWSPIKHLTGEAE